jgi:hypothetical protein
MEFVTCDTADDLPAWLADNKEAHEAALGYLEEGYSVLVVRRRDDAVQVVTQIYLDLDVVQALMQWASERV